jgi:hypothetical protein
VRYRGASTRPNSGARRCGVPELETGPAGASSARPPAVTTANICPCGTGVITVSTSRCESWRCALVPATRPDREASQSRKGGRPLSQCKKSCENLFGSLFIMGFCGFGFTRPIP